MLSQFYYITSVIRKKAKRLDSRLSSLNKNLFHTWKYRCSLLSNHDHHHTITGRPTITWQSKIAPHSANDRYFTSGFIKGHFCSALLVSYLYFITPRHHPMFPNGYVDVAFLFQKDRLESLWWKQHLSMVNQFLEDMASVSLSSLSICFTEHLELQSSKIFSVMLSHISQLPKLSLGIGKNLFAYLPG